MASEKKTVSEVPSDNDTASMTVTNVGAHSDPQAGSSANVGLDVEKATTTSPGNTAAGGLQWDGPDDPDNPMNWSAAMRQGQVLLVAALLLTVNLCATMYAPGTSLVMKEFDFDSEVVASLTVSVFVLGFAVGPLLWAPLSELYGRLPIYAVSTAVFLAFILGSAFATNLGEFMAFRFISGSAGAAGLAMSGGTLADVIPISQRGRWMALFVLGPLIGPTIGPIMGGFIAQRAGWRWVFRVMSIAIGVLSAGGVFLLRETYAPVILRRREARRRKERGEAKAVAAPTVGGEFRRCIVRPLKLLFLSPIVFAISLYGAFCFGLLLLLFTTFSAVFMGQYAWSVEVSGLSYIGVGLGMISGLAVQAVVGDRMMRWLEARNGRTKPEDRLPLMAVTAPAIPIGMFWYGWSTYKQAHWIVPIIGTFPVGIGITFFLTPSMLYLVDCFGAEAAASALAANTLLRSIGGAFLPLAGPPLYRSLGLGWGNSLLGFLAVAMLPIPWVFFLYGEKIRLSRKIKL